MTIYISTNVFLTTGLSPIKDLLPLLNDDSVGFELFPNWKNKSFRSELKDFEHILKDLPLTVHGPYFGVEHSEKKGSKEYDEAMDQMTETVELCRNLNIKHLVFHHNNKVITDENRLESIKHSRENLKELNERLKNDDIAILLENAGVHSKRNVLFNEVEFINECLNEVNNVLIDIGHVHANSWNLENVIKSLKHKITHYHLHNNDGVQDSHERILDGTLNFEEFIKLYKEHTPNAHLILEYGLHIGEDVRAIAEDVKYIKEKFKIN
ncbi:sugar phosphate isomerase/epimerase family protein [Cytobacillus dafuensis]|uniref:Sugar phosphate isomerase/epimerase n=1 Tax=Cytobacillus dafuensis TaxID=1742359 RepID=A0A5B8Z0S0_CYTDA|nr:TIM barrel protein [Cytobacillus dafuensis]QED46498.1 sugar phosphate isomerase/epimerase [Cytobacillus dafuensis]